jgi:hypothetical protein
MTLLEAIVVLSADRKPQARFKDSASEKAPFADDEGHRFKTSNVLWTDPDN